jgi:hypothetical protein
MTLLVLLFTALISSAQSSDSSSYQISGGFSCLSNTMNGVPGARQPLLGWDASLASPAWRNLRFKIDYSGFLGKNLGASQHPSRPHSGDERRLLSPQAESPQAPLTGPPKRASGEEGRFRYAPAPLLPRKTCF